MSEIIRPGFIWTFPGAVDSVTDGDTIVVHILWRPGEEGHGINVRIEGINAIELSQKFGAEARDYLLTLLPSGTQVTLVARKREKYGRFLSQVILPDGRSAGQEMLTKKASDGVTPLAIPYNL
jgi:endonuclease YncB( thermonuclease family)